jgi:hypothetical protein
MAIFKTDPREQRVKLFDALYENCKGGSQVNLRAIPQQESPTWPVSELLQRSGVFDQQLEGFLKAHGDDRFLGLYFAVATRNDGAKKEHIEEIPALWVDIDFKDVPEDRARRQLEEFLFLPSAVVSTGGGLHVYWLLKEPATREEIEPFEKTLKRLAHTLGGDLRAAEAARVLRVPGTFNRKPEYESPRPVELELLVPERRYNYEDVMDNLPETLSDKPSRSDGSTPEVDYRKISSEEIDRIMECAFMQHCDRDRTRLSEPEWYCMVSQLAGRTGGPAKIHELSRGYPKYDPKETDKKILHAMNSSGPHTCEFIKESWECGKDCGVKAPAALAYERECGTVQPTNDAASHLAFPEEVMAGLAGDFAELYSRYLEVPKHFFYIGFLTCLGICLADRLTLASEVKPQPRFYVVLLGESADDRKSTALTKVTGFFKEALPETFQVCYGVGSAEGLQKRLEGNGSLLLCLDEFKQFVSKCKIDSSVLLPCVTTLFESNRYESRTKTVNIQLEKAYLSLLAASTVQTYERTWDASFTDIGFNNRLFLVPGKGERKHSVPATVPGLEKDLLVRRLKDVIRQVERVCEVSLTPGARALYDFWYMNRERSIHVKRLDTYSMRLMPLLAVNELKSEVDEEIVRKVIALANWQLEVRREYDPIDADNKTAAMEEKIRRALKTGPRTDRELKQSTHANRAGLWFYDTAIKNLEHAEEIHRDRRQKRWCLVTQ